MIRKLWAMFVVSQKRIRLLQARLKIAYDALDKLQSPLAGEWHGDIARKAIKDMLEVKL